MEKISINEIENLKEFEKQGDSNYTLYSGVYRNNDVIVKTIPVRQIASDQIVLNEAKSNQSIEICGLQFPGMVHMYGWGEDFENCNFVVIDLLDKLPDFLNGEELQKIYDVVFSVTRKLYTRNFNWTPSYPYDHVLYDKNRNPVLIDFNDDNDPKASYLNTKDWYDYTKWLLHFTRQRNGEISKEEIMDRINSAINKAIVEEYQSLSNVHQPIFFEKLKETLRRETEPGDPDFGNLVPANRFCVDRADIIQSNITEELNGLTLTDFGTNVGWFCFFFNSLGVRTLGIDFDLEKIKFNRFLAEQFDVTCRFEHIKIGLDTIRDIEPTDIVLGLSIFHLFFSQHKYNPVDWIELMKLVCQKAKKYFIIEVSTEVFEPLRLSSYDQFAEFLQDIGEFKNSKIIGTAKEGRPLVMCERQ